MDALKKPEMLLGVANTTGLVALWMTHSRSITTLTERITQLEKITSEIVTEMQKLAPLLQNSGAQMQALSHAVNETKQELKNLGKEQNILKEVLSEGTTSDSRPFRLPKALEAPKPRRQEETAFNDTDSGLSHAEVMRRHKRALQT